MCTETSNDLGKITSGDEIWSWEIQKMISIFSETVKDRVIKFSLMIDLSKNSSRILIYLAIRRKTYSLLATRTFLVIIIIIIIIILFPFFCPGDFSETAWQIFLKFSGKMQYINTSGSFFHLSKIHFRSANMADFLFLKSAFVQQFSLKRLKIESWNFHGW